MIFMQVTLFAYLWWRNDLFGHTYEKQEDLITFLTRQDISDGSLSCPPAPN